MVSFLETFPHQLPSSAKGEAIVSQRPLLGMDLAKKNCRYNRICGWGGCNFYFYIGERDNGRRFSPKCDTGGVGLTVKFRPRGSDPRNAMLLGPSSHTHLPPGFTASMALQRCFYFLVLATIQILFLNSVISTTSLPSTSSSTPTTEFPISQVAYWSPADDCVRSCATAATSQYANSLSCTNSNPIPCICQNPIDPANSARECALLSCSAPATDPDIVGIQGKEIILQWCSSNQYSTSASNVAGKFLFRCSI